MTLVDTNILVYATIPGFPEHARCRAVLDAILAGDEPHHLTWVNVFEYLRIVTHRKLVRPKPLTLAHALDNVQLLFAHASISRIDAGPRHLDAFAEVCRQAAPVEGNFGHDCRIAAIMRENGVKRILTRDAAFQRIPGVEVVDPLAS